MSIVALKERFEENHANQESVIEACHLSKSFSDVVAVNDVSLTIKRGEIIALLGPNGAGKTTLTNLLLGRLIANSGKCTLFGEQPRNIKVRQRVGVMLQVSQVPSTLTVSEHIECFRQYYVNPLPLTEILKMTGLEDLADKRFGKLSGGQQQRVLFAIAICGDPELLFLDEPTVGLDVEARRQFWSVIKMLKAKGVSILLTTHYLEEADALADTIYVLSSGKIIASGSPQQIKQNSAGKLIRCRSGIDLKLLESRKEIISCTKQNKNLEIHSQAVEETVRFLLNQDQNLSELSILDASLEQAFVDIIQNDSTHSSIKMEQQ